MPEINLNSELLGLLIAARKNTIWRIISLLDRLQTTVTPPQRNWCISVDSDQRFVGSTSTQITDKDNKTKLSATIEHHKVSCVCIKS